MTTDPTRDVTDAMIEAGLKEAHERSPIFGGWRPYVTAIYLAMRAADTRTTASPADVEPFQQRVQPWMMECFGPEIAADKLERNDRFIEEALELVQATGYSKDRAHALVDYVFDRPQGDVNQEVGGVMVTLAALCLANGFDMHEAAEAELARVWTKVDQIRAKQAAKPKGSALPIAAPADHIAGAGKMIAAEPVNALVEALEDARGHLASANVLIAALSGRPSIAVETGLERADAALTAYRSAPTEPVNALGEALRHLVDQVKRKLQAEKWGGALEPFDLPAAVAASEAALASIRSAPTGGEAV